MLSEDEKRKPEGAEIRQEAGTGEEYYAELSIGEIEARADRAVAGVERAAASFIEQVERDKSSGTDADAKEAVREIKAVVVEAKKAKRTFSARLAELARAPGKKLKEHQVKRRTEALATPDNPKIMQEIKDRLKKIEALRDRLRDRAYAKRDDRDPLQVDQDIFCGEDVSKEIDETAELYQKAKKVEKGNWAGVERGLVPVIVQSMKAHAAKGDFDKALSRWDALPERKQEDDQVNESLLRVIFRKEIDHIKATYPSQDQRFDAATFIKKLEAYDAFDRAFSQKVKDRFPLHQAYEWRKKDWLRGLMFSGSAERSFLDQPREVVQALSELPKAQQQFVSDAWLQAVTADFGVSSIDWPDVLQDPRRGDIIDLFIAFPEARYYKKEKDHEAVYKILDNFSPDERTAAREKVKSAMGSQEWDMMYTYLFLGSLPNSTASQIEGLSREQVQALTAITIAYGEETIRGLWNDEQVQDFTETSGYLDENGRGLIQFSKSLSPALRGHLPTQTSTGSGFQSHTRPGHTVWSNRGMRGLERALARFQEWWEHIPASMRDEVAPYLHSSKSLSYIGHDDRLQALSEEQTRNFLEYQRAFDSPRAISIEELVRNATYFSPERWVYIKKGVDTFKTMELAERTQKPNENLYENLYDWLDVFEMAGKVDAEKAHELIRLFVTRSDSFVQNNEYRGHGFRKRERGPSEIKRLYDFANTCTRYFERDTDLTAKLLHLSGEDQRVISAFLDESLLAQGDRYVDLPMIEGRMLRLADIFHGRNSENVKAQLEGFVDLSREQKQRYLDLRTGLQIGNTPSDYAVLFNLAKNEKGAQLAEFFAQSGISGFPLSLAEKMMNRPDCIGLFYYLQPHGNKAEDIERMIDRFIALKDAGCPTQYFSTEKETSQIINVYEMSHNELYKDWFLQWDMEKLATVANAAAEAGFQGTLRDLLRLPADGKLEELTQVLQMAALQKETMLFHPDIYQFKEDNVFQLQQRIRDAEGLLGVELPGDVRRKIDKFSSQAWNRFKQDREILQYALHSNEYGNSLDVIAGFSDELLKNPLFWKLPSGIISDMSSAQKALALDAGLQAAGLAAIEGDEATWRAWLETRDRAPWLFSQENLDFFRTIGIHEIHNFSDISEAEFQTLQPLLNSYQIDKKDIPEFLQYVKDGQETIPIELLQTLKGKLGMRLSWSLLKEIQSRIHEGQDLDTIIAEFDAQWDEGVSLFGRGEVTQWRKLREEKIASFLKDPVGFISHFGGSRNQWARLEQLDANTLRNFEEISKAIYRPNDPNEFEALIFISRHPNFETLLYLRDKNKDAFSRLASIPRPQLEFICEHITRETIDRYMQLPEYLKMDPRDFVAFLQDPSADHAIELAKELRAIFGEKCKMSIYDLLIMDVEADLARLKTLQQNSLHPLAEETLKGLALVAEGSISATIQKTLSIFDERAEIDFSLATAALKKLTPHLRSAVIQEKGVKSFGWAILQHQDELHAFGMDDAAVDALIRELYSRPGKRPSQFDYQIASAILSDGTIGSEEKQERIKDVMRLYQGDLNDLVELLLKDQKTLAEAVVSYDDWKVVPETLKQVPVFWEALLRETPVSFWNRYAEMPPHINMPKDLMEQSVAIYIQADGSLEFLTPDAPLGGRMELKRSFFETHIGNILQDWEKDRKGVADILARVATQGALGVHHLPRVYEMLIAFRQDAQSDSTAIAQVERALAESIIRIDPTVRRTFTDPKRLGRLKDVVVRNLVEYLKEMFDQGPGAGADMLIVEQKMRHKLLEIRRVFESSDSSESERRMIFLDMYNLTECRDPSVAEDIKDAAVIRRRIEQDVREVLIRSGSDREARFLRRAGNDELIKRYEEVLRGADLRNRKISEFLPDSALTHGTGSQNLSLILDGGNFTGELLGPQSRSDASGLLGVDLGKVVDSTDPASGGKLPRSFSERFSGLINLSYGDIHLIYGEYQNNPFNQERLPYVAYGGGSSPEAPHQLVRTGIPSSEITAIVVKQIPVLGQVKKDVAAKGFYIPLLDTSGDVIFSQEEFDEMKVFYNGLSKKGYPMKIIDDVYAFYKNPQGSDKHKVVIQKAFEDAKTPQAGGKEAEDLAILVSFLRSNDLNARSLEWYQGATFGQIKSAIKGVVGRRSRAKARAMLFENPPQESLSLQEAVKAVKQLRRKANVFLDNFFNTQLPFSGQGGQVEKYEEAVVDLLFNRKGEQRIPEVSKMFTEQKKGLMRQLWTKVWDETLGDANLSADDRQALERKKESLIPVMTGSAGRGEIVLGSDLDYLILVDDETTPLEDEEGLTRLINEVLAPKMNAILKQNGLMGDAGLARKGRTPFSKMSRIKQFTIDLNVSRQEEEPTNIVDAEALFDTPRDREIVARSKKYLIEENPSAHLLNSFVLRDLELPSGNHPSYIEQFENLYNNFASGEVLQKIKESLQRVVTFKTYHVMFGAFEDGRISKTEAPEIPSSTIGKIDFLADRRILTEREAGICKELLAITYKLRFLGELYSKEAEGGEARKVSNVQFRVEDLSYDERARLFGLLKDFKTEVLYK